MILAIEGGKECERGKILKKKKENERKRKKEAVKRRMKINT